MALLSTSHTSLFFSQSLNNPLSLPSPKTTPSLSFPSMNLNLKPLFSTSKPTLLLPFSSYSVSPPDPDLNPNPNPNPEPEPNSSANPNPGPRPESITDEWGEKGEPEPEYPNILDSDPPRDEDEWEEEEEEEKAGYVSGGNGSAAKSIGVVVEKDERVEDLKRCLVDTVYGTDFGFRASPEVRAEVLELVNQLEALNPTPAPVEASGVLDGNWVLLFTAFSELLPLLAVGAAPFLKVNSISQSIDSSNLSIVNSTTLSNPFATLSFSASATFEVRSTSRIQVEFKEGTLQPPEIKSNIDLPENLDLFGLKINLLPVQQSLNPLQEAVANISRTISGQPPLKVPIPGNRSRSWLLITYLDEDLRISRGDGGLFVLAKEGSPLLDQ